MEEGRKLVSAARSAIELSIASNNFRHEVVERTLYGFEQKHGIFVTLYHFPTKTLRGCIGFSEGAGQIRKLVIDAAIAAAMEDPRFVPLSGMELEHTIIEVSVLSKTEKISGDPASIKRQIFIGRDGLVIEYGYFRGLFLPVVPVEQHWSVEEYLNNLCIKAGLSEHTWEQPGVYIGRFSAQVFAEASPKGEIREVKPEEL